MPHPPHPVPLIFSMLSLCISHSQSLDSHFTRLHMPHPLHPVSLTFPCFHSASPIHIRYVCTSLTRHCTCEVPGGGCDCPLHCLCSHHQHVSLHRLFSLPSLYRSHSQSLDSLSSIRLYMLHHHHPVSCFPCIPSVAFILSRCNCISLVRPCTCEVTGCRCDRLLHCLRSYHPHVTLHRLFPRLQSAAPIPNL